MAESKDQKRTRLKNEGKALIAEGRHSEVTPQHQNAIEYFARKNKSSGAKEKEDNAARQTNPDSPELVSKDEQTYIPSGSTSFFDESTAAKHTSVDPNPFLSKPRTLNNYPNAINEDNTHHAMLGTLGDHLSTKLNEAHEAGLIHPQDATHIDQQLRVGHIHLENSQNAHERGDISEAKNHMQLAADAYYGAASQLEHKNIALATPGKKVGAMAKDIAKGYINSKVPGMGAAPHEGFNTTRIRRQTSPESIDTELTPETNRYQPTFENSKDALPEMIDEGEHRPKKKAKVERPVISPEESARRKVRAAAIQREYVAAAPKESNWQGTPTRQERDAIRAKLAQRQLATRKTNDEVAAKKKDDHLAIAWTAAKQGNPIPAETTEALGASKVSEIQSKASTIKTDDQAFGEAHAHWHSSPKEQAKGPYYSSQAFNSPAKYLARVKAKPTRASRAGSFAEASNNARGM